MTRFIDIDPINIPLEGTNLIEASAGTGKTYTISSLYLRLILEKGLSVNQILVVTFTRAATEELKDRIRRKLRQCMDAFKRGQHEDQFLGALAKKNDYPDEPLRCLEAALRDFDEAAIFTIHGFCQRMLFENAFESGCPFDTELITDEQKLREEIMHEFWRKHFYRADPEFVNYILSKGLSPASFLNRLRSYLVHPELRIIPDIKTPEIKSLELFRKGIGRLKHAWSGGRAGVREKLMDQGLNGRVYGTNTLSSQGHSKRDLVVSDLVASMDRIVSSEKATFPLFGNFEKLTSRVLASSMKKGHAPPDHEIFHICDQVLEKAQALEREMDQLILFLKTEMFRYVRQGLPAKKQEWNIRSFDDLLMDMRQVLEDQSGITFAREVRAKYKAALIDEFQDTDPIQYAIFRTLFGTDRGSLFLIGDPKQAIYGFRGADLFTYMKAAGQIKTRYTLLKNWRSEAGLIASINTVFSGKNLPFLYKEIPYTPAMPGEKKDLEYLSIEGRGEPPLQLWILDATSDRGPLKPLTKTRARELIPKALGGEILRLVTLGRENRAFIGDTPLKERHVAVLVRKNREARLVQEALAELKIPSVLYSSGNLFDSVEAMEAERVLGAVAEPDNENLLRGALTTDILGVTGEELDQLMEEEEEWESIIYRFREYHELWNSKGFIRMFRYLISREKVRARLLDFADGERRLTNLLHLSEVLHRESFDKNLGMTRLLKWLSEQRDSDSPRLEEHQLRLESDEEAVKIVTIHKSKGLEYPVVFCPFIWDGSEIRGDEITFHDEKHDFRLTLDLGSPENQAHKDLAEQELLAENLRLLYVALTRAKNRCYLVWGRINGAETSALAYLFHGPRSLEPGNVVEATGSHFLKSSGKDLIKEVKRLVDEAEGTIQLSSLPQERPEGCLTPVEEARSLTCRTFSATIPLDWKVSSFSSLVSAGRVVTELPDHDTMPIASKEAEEAFELTSEEEGVPTGIFAFPRGAKAGTFLHDLLEHLDFAEKEPAGVKRLVASKLDEYGFESKWLDTISDTIRNLLNIPLDPELEDLRLSCIRNKDRLNEVEFYFPLKTVSPQKLKRIFHEKREAVPGTIGRLQFAPSSGFMKGFMDLVFQWRGRFYLVDWKSNYLGSRTEDYGQGSLALEMNKEFYILQYYIYTLALDQYLRLRLPGYSYEKHFGGAFYIFLRGIDPEKGPNLGIYRDLPSPELINELKEELIEKSRLTGIGCG